MRIFDRRREPARREQEIGRDRRAGIWHTIGQAPGRLGVTRSAVEHAACRARAVSGREHLAQRARFAAVSGVAEMCRERLAG